MLKTSASRDSRRYGKTQRRWLSCAATAVRRLLPASAVVVAALGLSAAGASAVECYEPNPMCKTQGAFEALKNVGPGATMPTTTTYFVYWDPKGVATFPKVYQSGITAFFKGLQHDNGTDQNFYSVLTQYGVSYDTHFGAAIADKDPYPAETPECAKALTRPCVGDFQVATELRKLVAAGKLPGETAPGRGLTEAPTRVYFVLLPPGASTCTPHPSGGIGVEGAACSVRNFCSSHTDTITVRSVIEGKEAVYKEVESPTYEGSEVFSVEPYNVGLAGCDTGQHPNGIADAALERGMAHEFAEMITNPYGDGWINSAPGEQQEVADICADGRWAFENEAFSTKMAYGTPLGTAPDGALYNQVVDGRDYYIQQMWSNEAGGCRPSRGLPPTVAKLSKTAGPVAGGTKVKVTGLNFVAPTVTSVRFGTRPAKSFSVSSPTSLTAVAPASSAPETVDLTLTTSAGTSSTVPADQFKYE